MILASSVHLRNRAACLAGFLTDSLAAFLAGAFLAAVFLTAAFLAPFLAGAFLAAAFFAGAFLAAFFGAAFFAALLVGAFFRAPLTAATVESNAALTAPAASSAAAIPNPTANPAFSAIVSSAIFSPLRLCVHIQSRIVEVYRSTRSKLLLLLPVLIFLPSSAPRSFCQTFPHQATEKPFDSARAYAFAA